MDENINTGGGGNTGLALLVGALVVAVLVIAFFLFGGGFNAPGSGDDVDINIQPPQTESPATPGTGEPAPGGNQ